MAPGLVVYLGTGGLADEHAHHAVQFVWVSTGKAAITNLAADVEASAALIPARSTHSFDAKGLPLLLLLVDAHGARGEELDRIAKDSIGKDLATKLAAITFPTVETLRADNAAAWATSVLAALGVRSTETQAPSRATRRAIAYIEASLEAGVPRLSEAAVLAATSESRLSHRFTEEIGLPFRRFVLWARIKRAVEVTRDGGDLTKAAVTAGFSDAAHLSRTFRAMFGLSPSLVLPFVELSAPSAQRANSGRNVQAARRRNS